MQEEINKKIIETQRALGETNKLLEDLKNIDPNKFTSQVKKTILKIADNLDDHINKGEPYSLTFFHVGFGDWRPTQRPSPELKAELEKYLEHEFKIVWGGCWIKGEAKRLRDLMETLGTER